MIKSSKEFDEKFFPGEYVDIIDSKKSFSYEGKIVSIKGQKIIVKNMNKNKEEVYNIDDKRIIKQWSPGKPIKKYNRVDFRLKGTDYWVEGIVIDIMPNNELLIRYKNNNNFKRTCEEQINLKDSRIARPGYFTKFDEDNNKLSSSTISDIKVQKLTNLNISEINIGNNINILTNKRKRSEEKNEVLNEDEKNFKSLLLKNNMQIKEVKSDGNCMFRAVSDQVYGKDEYYELLREKCMDYIVILRNFFEPFIEDDFDFYIKEKRKNQTWGDDIELEALSEIYNRPIEIYKGSNIPLKTFHENKYFSDDEEYKNNNFSLTPIRLSYHNKNHYNSIIPLESDKINYRRYKDSLIRTKPGYFESKMIQTAKYNEAELEEGIQESNNLFQRLKNNLSEKIEDIANKNNLIEEENNKNKEIKEKSKDKINKKDKENENKKNENIKNKNYEEYNFLSNSTIKSAVELGYDYEDAIEAWSLYGDNKELVINYLLSKYNNNN